MFQVQRRCRSGVGRPPRHGPAPEGGAEGQEERGHGYVAQIYKQIKLVKMWETTFFLDVGDKMALSAEEEDSCEEEEEGGGQKSEDKLK